MDDLPHPHFKAEKKSVLAGSIELDDGLDARTAEIFYHEKNQKIELFIETCPEAKSAEHILRNLSQEYSVFAYKYLAVVQKRLNSKYKKKEKQRCFFNTPKDVKVITGFINPLTYQLAKDALSFQCTVTSSDM